MNKSKLVLILLLMAGVAIATVPTRYESGFIVWAYDLNLNGNAIYNGTVNLSESISDIDLNGYSIYNGSVNVTSQTIANTSYWFNGSGLHIVNNTAGLDVLINDTGLHNNGTMFWGKMSKSPTSGNQTGDTYYNTSRNKICWYNGTGWNSTSDAITNC